MAAVETLIEKYEEESRVLMHEYSISVLQKCMVPEDEKLVFSTAETAEYQRARARYSVEFIKLTKIK